MKKAIIGTAALLAATVLSGQANAAVIYQNGGPNNTNGNEMSQWIQTEDFRLATAASIGSASFYTLGAANVGLTYYIFAAGNNQPGALLASGTAQNPVRTATGATPIGFVENLYTFDFASAFNAAANTTYWFGLRFTGNNGDVYWETTNANATLTGRESFGGTFDNWSDNGQEHSFALSTAAAVPEPATWAMMLLGFGMMGAAMRYGSRKTKVAIAT